MWEENLGTSAGVHLIYGVQLNFHCSKWALYRKLFAGRVVGFWPVEKKKRKKMFQIIMKSKLFATIGHNRILGIALELVCK